VGSRAVLNAVVKIKSPRHRRESNPRTPIVQPVARRNSNKLNTILLYKQENTRIDVTLKRVLKYDALEEL
jgi:hypothetical protein